MKNIINLSILLILPVILNAQIALTHSNNAILAGDSSKYSEISFIEPGIPGADRIWDFSNLQFTGKTPVSKAMTQAANKPDGFNDYNLVLNDNGYEYYLSVDENGYQEKGYVNKDNKMSMIYTDPINKMRFPLKFGDTYSDPFSGVAWYDERNRIDLTGDYTVEADAFGTLILPDRLLKDVLRVKTVRKGLQIGVCGSLVSNVTKYFWYARGYKYPVLSTSELQLTQGGNQPTYTRSAFLNLNQTNAGNSIGGINNSDDQNKKEGISVIMFPNPFSEKITYNYFLRKSLSVSVELYDITGSNRLLIIKNQSQTEGLHTGDLDGIALGLTPGVYYVRFTFDKQVVVRKIVKINS
ncbi:MAG: T9SS type A sorting domain-containing protein [Bacteroidetes bacterium]|nr:T9SS type A sorting domain-containing protein [Bacteroidota bacterium]